jgi:hypothetical protein
MSRWLVDAARIASHDVARGKTLAYIKERARALAHARVPMANVREVAFMAEAVLNLARRARRCPSREESDIAEFLSRPANIREMEKAANEMDRRLQVKAKAQALAETLQEPCVFYVVTTHQKPRCSHRALQGYIAYDRAYRQKIPQEAVRDVERFIKQNNMKSVQELSGPPYYISTALYCYHRFVPLDTKEVLEGRANTLVRDGAHRSKTDAERYREYKARRRLIALRAKKPAIK